MKREQIGFSRSCVKNSIFGKLPGFATRTGKFCSNESSPRNLAKYKNKNKKKQDHKTGQLIAYHKRNNAPTFVFYYVRAGDSEKWSYHIMHIYLTTLQTIILQSTIL